MSGRCVILGYHRVNDLSSDPQLLAVSPDNFRDQLDVVREIGTPISLRDLIQAMHSNSIPERSVCLTFDDGYADNLEFAAPLMEDARVPGTVFVSTAWMDTDNEFWWDELERLLLLPGNLPKVFSLQTAEASLEIDLGSDASYDQPTASLYDGWSVLDKETPTSRHKAYRAVYELLFKATSEERRNVLQVISELGNMGMVGRKTHRCLSAEQVRRLDANPWVEVGGHCHTHPVLSAMTEGSQRFEVVRGKESLEEALDHPVDLFSYPYGGKVHYDESSTRIVSESGFICATSNFPGSVGCHTDPYQLPRHLVRNWSAESFSNHLQSWLDQAASKDNT